MKCMNCHRDEERSDDENRGGGGRRYPPAPAAKKSGEYPLVGAQGWCGELQRATEAEARSKG